MKTVAIFMAGQRGDQMSALSVMKYRKELWGDCKIVWYSNADNFDNFKHQDIEVREFPRGFGYPEMVIEENRKLVEAGKEPAWEDWAPLVDHNNHLNLELKNNYPSLADIDLGYFPAPHQMTPPQRDGIEYPNVSKKVFGVEISKPWHPCLGFSDEDFDKAELFFSKMGKGKRVLIESFGGSGQSRLDGDMIRKSMQLCRDQWGDDCNFIFASHKYLHGDETFPPDLINQPNVYSCSDFTVRQCALVAGECNLMISVSSGISVAASCWFNNPTAIIQYCGSVICSTRALALGRFELVTADDKMPNDSKTEFYYKLQLLLKEGK